MDKDILTQLETRFGSAFTESLRACLRMGDVSAGVNRQWQVGQDKDRFSEVLDKVRDGGYQVVRRHNEEPVLMISLEQLATFIDMASPRRRFAELIKPDPDLPVAKPIFARERPRGMDHVEL